eukprot:7376173-Prymnesium_polylepis.1
MARKNSLRTLAALPGPMLDSGEHRRGTTCLAHRALPSLALIRGVMKARMLNIGSRLVAASASTTDALQGTQHLLTTAGRSALISHYRDSYDAGAHAVTTAINT